VSRAPTVRASRRRRLDGQQLEESAQTGHEHRRVHDVKEVGVTGHDPLSIVLDGQGEEIVIIRISTHGRDLCWVVHVPERGQHLVEEAAAVLLPDEPGDLRPSKHVGNLSHQPRAQQELEAALDASGDDPTGHAIGGDGGGHKHARVQDDQHYEALRRSTRAARSSW
jgi:hypothetical protein